SPPCTGVIPMARNKTLANPFIDHIIGLKMMEKTRSGHETANVDLVGNCIANDFGANTPNTICNIVIITKASGNDKLCANVSYSGPEKPIRSKVFRITGVNEHSPTHAHPNEANVIPNCVAAK